MSLALGPLIAAHGYLLLVLGCLAEGETVLALAGYAAHRGYLQLPWVMVIAAATGFAGDQFFFWLGRWQGRAMLQRWQTLAAKARRVHCWVEGRKWIIIGLRFAYGLRIAGPITIGASKLPARHFVVFDGIGAAIWASTIPLLGWFMGAAIQTFIGRAQRVERWAFVGLIGAGLAVWVARWWRHHRQRRRRP